MIASRSRSSICSLLALVVVGALVCLPQSARAQSIAVSAHASTFGPGAAATVAIGSKVNVRTSVSYLPFTHSGVMQDEVDVRYDVTGQLAAINLFLDWHPFGNAFRLSTGAVYDRSYGKGQAQPTESYTLQGKTFSPEQLGDVDAKISFANSVHPYVGIGLGNAVRGSRMDVFIDFGAMYIHRPDVKMEGSGLIAGTANHASTLNEGLKSFRVLPYLAMGMSLSL